MVVLYYTLLGTHTQNLDTHSKKIRAIVLEYSGIGGFAANSNKPIGIIFPDEGLIFLK